jgi:hypothetical protein
VTEFDCDEQKCNIMDRRALLAKGAVSGAIVVGGGLITGVGTALGAAKPSGYGYRVGDQAADFGGYDQYMKPRKMSNNLGSWTLIDLCPVWCPPCNASARFQFGFTNYIRSQGIPFHMQPVVVETQNPGEPSTRLTAEQWAVRYELEREALMHDNGDPNSPLRQLFFQYAQANNNPTPGYPTYVLVDPNGVIRDYILGADLNAVQASLANLTGKTLNQDWTDESLIPAYAPQVDPNVGSASFKLWDGTAVVMPGPSGHIENQYCIFDTSGDAVSIDLWSKLGDPVTASGGGPVRNPSKEFDLHSPITMTFKAVISPVPGSFRKITVFDAYFFEYAPGYYPGGAVGKGSAELTTTFNPDGSIQLTYTASDFFSTSWAGSNDNDRASNETFVPYHITSAILPYQSALDLTESVHADESLSSTTQSTVASLLGGGCAKLGNRDYAGSAQQFAKAQSTLAAAGSFRAGSAGDIKDHVAWLGTQYNS